MRRFIRFALGSVLIFAILIGCNVKATSTPATAPQPVPAPVIQPTAPATAASPQQTAWDQVVAAAKKEGIVVSYTNEMVGDIGAVIKESFRESSGIRLELITIGSAARGERIRSEARAGIYVADVSDGSSVFQSALKIDKLTQSTGDLPVFFEKGVWELDPQKIDSERHQVYYNITFTSVWINTRLIKTEEEPRSWYDLLDPKWKGKKIGVSHPVSSSQAYIAYANLIRQAGFKNDYFQRLGQQDMKFVVGTHRDLMINLAQGANYIAFAGTTLSGLPLIKEGAPIKPLVLKEGTRVAGSTMSLLANAPHPNATRVFINWVLGKEGQKVLSQIRNASSLRKDVPDFSPSGGQVKYDPLLVVDSKEADFAEAIFREQVLTKMWIK